MIGTTAFYLKLLTLHPMTDVSRIEETAEYVLAAETFTRSNLLELHGKRLGHLPCVMGCSKSHFQWAIKIASQECFCAGLDFTWVAYLEIQSYTCSSKTIYSYFCVSSFIHGKFTAYARDPPLLKGTQAHVYRTRNIKLSCYMEKSFFPSGEAPYIGIISYPGSGNTWFRSLLEKTTGYYTGSVYAESELFEHGKFIFMRFE